MSKRAAKATNIALATVAMEPYIANASLDFTQEAPDVTALSDAGPRVVIGNYGFGVSMDGAADFATGLQDATMFGMVSTTAVKALAFDPTGSTAADADNPHYDATDVVLTAYSIKSAVGAAVTYSFAATGNSSMTRAVA